MKICRLKKDTKKKKQRNTHTLIDTHALPDIINEAVLATVFCSFSDFSLTAAIFRVVKYFKRKIKCKHPRSYDSAKFLFHYKFSTCLLFTKYLGNVIKVSTFGLVVAVNTFSVVSDYFFLHISGSIWAIT